jgi:ABC-type nitrate/sulfonate/bicarbonate transport system substrate-binding protein
MTTPATRFEGLGRIRRSKLAGTGAIVAVAAIALTACSSSGSKTAPAAAQSSLGSSAASSAPAVAKPFTLKIGLVTKVGVDGILGWSDSQQILEKDLAPVGVTKIEFSTFATGPTLNAALTSGSVNVAQMGDTPALQLRATGFASRAIAISGINTDYTLVGKKGGPTTLAALAGKKVSAAPGTAPEQYLIELLQQQGLSDKIKISNLQTNDAATALKAGSIDAFVASGPMAATFASQGYPIIDKASDHTGLYTTSVNIASQKFLDEHPGFAQAWGQALADAVKSIKASSTQYWAFAAKAEKVTVPIATAANPLNNYPDTAFSADGVTQITASYNFLQKQGKLKAPFDLNAWFDKG